MFTKEELIAINNGLVHACNMLGLLEKYGDAVKCAEEKTSYLRLLGKNKEIYEGLVAKEKIEAEKAEKKV